ncbi:MAG: phosphate ABC transporter permease subunit PstC [Opitutales bacterium]
MSDTPGKDDSAQPLEAALVRENRGFLARFEKDRLIKAFFGGNAFVALIVLALITVFLFREGLAFFDLHDRQLRLYREAGLEYVNYVIEQNDDFVALSREASELDIAQLNKLAREFEDKAKQEPQYSDLSERDLEDAKWDYVDARYDFDTRAWFFDLSDLGRPLTDLQVQWQQQVRETRDNWLVNATQRKRIAVLKRSVARLYNEASRIQDRLVALDNNLRGDSDEAIRLKNEAADIDRQLDSLDLELRNIVIIPVDLAESVDALREDFPEFRKINEELIAGAEKALQSAPTLPSEDIQKRFEQVRERLRTFIEETREREAEMAAWERTEPYSWGASLWYFLFGTEWNSGSAFQSFYGLLPLLTGSLLISSIALMLAVPFGVGMAIYVNQFAARPEREVLKPAVEFISAFPSVVLGFFGIVIWSTMVVSLSENPFFNWLPFFPVEARLNAFTAGSLLALMAVPTIFSLAEDALNNVPRAHKEASFAMGANRWQTAIRVIVPTALSGILSAVLLGFGRVIGETMVVLLVAGNRPEIPDFGAEGLGAIFEPVHTMTGSIAGGLGEAQTGAIHYRSLFCVGLVLFFVSLFINFVAQSVLKRLQRH